MRKTFTIKKDGKTCKISFQETSKGIKMSTSGKDCKKLMGKEHFKNMEMQFPENF